MSVPTRMMAVVTTGQGGTDRLDYREVPVPQPGPGEVLIKVLAAGVNNTEINTRLGWYSDSVTGGTDETDTTTGTSSGREDGGWNGATPFPFIQGADCCGQVVAGDGALVGARVLVRSCMRTAGFEQMDALWMGVDFDGAFAQYLKAPVGEVFPVTCDWTDAELASIPCAYGTAENAVARAGIGPGTVVLITGASGGVSSAAVQLAKRRGARVIAITSAAKRDALRGIGADQILTREDDPVATLGPESVDVVIDNVVGPGFGAMLEVLRRGGRYVSSGAIAGPVVPFDIRKMYLRDITMIGSTIWDEATFPNLIGYIERGEIKPLVAATYPLAEIATAQRVFQEKTHVGKIVLLPPE